MSRSKTAMLLSAFVMPGAGQLYLKHVLRGMVLIVVSLVCLWIIGHSMMQQVSTVLDQLQSGETALDAGHIAELVDKTPRSSASSIATWVLIGCWLIGMIDTYWLGKKPGAN
jgi:hypothetical protein